MNGWDLFTWIMALALAGSAVVIFVYFLGDVQGILKRDQDKPDEFHDGK
ncbi:MAG: hypothetical protein O7G86_02810 [Gammaproteobacteria bacterium]|nr:hypothetical protein [Gammaproteobacteria bacterium]MCZ6852828.1 hypothetical protein [Gammaproteobacteria bacterium]